MCYLEVPLGEGPVGQNVELLHLVEGLAVVWQRDASDGRDCAAPALARDPLEMVAVELQTLPFRGIKRQFHEQEDPIVDS